MRRGRVEVVRDLVHELVGNGQEVGGESGASRFFDERVWRVIDDETIGQRWRGKAGVDEQ